VAKEKRLRNRLTKGPVESIFVLLIRLIHARTIKVHLKFFRYSAVTNRARAETESFMSDISASMSCMNCTMKSTTLCLNMCSVWKLVTRKEMSYPYKMISFRDEAHIIINKLVKSDLDRLAAQNDEVFRTLR
jgi:hypothetical protein